MALLQTLREELMSAVAERPERAHRLGLETEPRPFGCDLYWRDGYTGQRTLLGNACADAPIQYALAVLHDLRARIRRPADLLDRELNRRMAEGDRRRIAAGNRRSVLPFRPNAPSREAHA